MKISLPSLKESKKTLEAGLQSDKLYIAALLALNTAYVLPQFHGCPDISSLLIASIPPVFITSIVLTLARDRYIKIIMTHRLMEDSYIPSVYKSNVS